MFWRIPSHCETVAVELLGLSCEVWALCAFQLSPASACPCSLKVFLPGTWLMHLDSGHTETNWGHTSCARAFFWEYNARFCQQIKRLIALTYIFQLHRTVTRWEEVEPRMELASCDPHACQHWLGFWAHRNRLCVGCSVSSHKLSNIFLKWHNWWVTRPRGAICSDVRVIIIIYEQTDHFQNTPTCVCVFVCTQRHSLRMISNQIKNQI